jgi:hypothetical protein
MDLFIIYKEIVLFMNIIRYPKIYNYRKFLFLFIYSHVCTLFGSFLPLCPPLLPSPPTPPLFQAESVLLLCLILLKRRHKHNRKDIEFLLVEIRIAIQRDS